jgi:flagellar hook-length control protein FliK
MAAGSSSLLAALAQTITDAATPATGGTNDLTQTAQAMTASFSSLLQQVTEGSARSEATSATLVQAAAPSDVQLANAVATASSPALAMATAPADAGASTNAAVVSPSTAAPIDTSRQNWPDALGSRVEWMLHQGLQEARIELHPRDMGSINVHIKLGNDGADVRFAATNPNVRDALEASMPKLREMLAGSGLQLAQAQVGSQMQQQESSGRFLPQQAPAQSPTSATGNAAGTDVQPPPDAPRVRVASLSIIDDYA